MGLASLTVAHVRVARTIAARAAAAGLLALPTVIAFSAGGFFEGARLRAAIIVWAGVAVLALVAPAPLSRQMRIALACLAGLAVWVTLSILWAPLRDGALGDAERVWLYVGYAVAASLVIRGRAVMWVEPILATGGVVVAGYALATRLVPGVVPSTHSLRAGARLDQPLTYWNAIGLLMAMTVVLLLHVACDPARRARIRTLAAAVVPAPGLALYLTFSRGGLVALAVGTIVLVALCRDRRATTSTIAGLGCAAAAAVAASRFPAVDSLDGNASRQGVAMLAILVALCFVAGGLHVAIQRGAVDNFRLRSRAGAAAAVVVAVFAVGAVVATTRSPTVPAQPTTNRTSGVQLPRTSARLATIKTNRPSYWKVALRGFAGKPLTGVGAHGFQQLWLQKRPISESVQDAHSLYLETAAELGAVGLLLLLGWLSGPVGALRAVLRTPSGSLLSAGWAAASAAFLVHAAQDWDWEMPAVSLPFIALTAALLGAAADGVVHRDRRQHDQRRLDRDPEARDPVDREPDHADRNGIGHEWPYRQTPSP